MAIEVDIGSLVKRRDYERRDLDFLVRADLPTLDLEFFVKVARGIRHQLESDGRANPVDAEGWVRTADGWTGVLTHVDDIDDALEWFELFEASFDPSINGTVLGGDQAVPHDTRPSRGPGRDGASDPEPTAFVAYSIHGRPDSPNGNPDNSWMVEPATTTRVADKSVSWTYQRGCTQSLKRSGWYLQPVGLDHAQALAEAAVHYTLTRMSTFCREPRRVRTVCLQPRGCVTFQMIDPTISWADRVGHMAELLTWASDATEVAFVRTNTGNAPLWSSDHQRWPFIGDTEVRYNRHLLTSYVPDVNGIQLLSDAHLARAHNLSDWSVEPVDGGRHLVQAKDLEPWYAVDPPDPDVLAKARADFGGMILTKEIVLANGGRVAKPHPRRRPRSPG